MSQKLDVALSWGLVVLGLLHCTATFFVHATASDAALWFFASGLAVVFSGMLNLNQLQHPQLTSLRISARISNLSLLTFAVIYAGRYPDRAIADPATWLLFLLVGGTSIFSFIRR